MHVDLEVQVHMLAVGCGPGREVDLESRSPMILNSLRHHDVSHKESPFGLPELLKRSKIRFGGTERNSSRESSSHARVLDHVEHRRLPSARCVIDFNEHLLVASQQNWALDSAARA